MDIGDLMSINRAIGRLQHLKKQIKTDIRIEFLIACCAWVQVRANEYLEKSDIGEAVKSDIKANWVITQTLNSAILTNTSEKAVYVEFGVGIVGGEMKHPNADKTSYQYNVPSEAKLFDGGWLFKTYEYELDLPHEAIDASNTTKDGKLRILTHGTKGCWYTYNALTDLATYPQHLKTIWNEVLVKYLG